MLPINSLDMPSTSSASTELNFTTEPATLPSSDLGTDMSDIDSKLYALCSELPPLIEYPSADFWGKFLTLPPELNDLTPLLGDENPEEGPKEEDDIVYRTFEAMRSDQDFMWGGDLFSEPLFDLDPGPQPLSYFSREENFPEDILEQPPSSPEEGSIMVRPESVTAEFIRPSVQKARVVVENTRHSMLKKDEKKSKGKRPDTPQSSESEEEQVRSQTARTGNSWWKTPGKLQEAQKRAALFDHNYDTKIYRPEELGVQTPSDSEADEDGGTLLEGEIKTKIDKFVEAYTVEEEVEDGNPTSVNIECNDEEIEEIIEGDEAEEYEEYEEYEDEEMVDIESVSGPSSPGTYALYNPDSRGNYVKISADPNIENYQQVEEPTKSRKRKRKQTNQPGDNKRQKRQAAPSTNNKRSKANRSKLPTNPEKNMKQIQEDVESAISENLYNAQKAVSKRLNGAIKKNRATSAKKKAVEETEVTEETDDGVFRKPAPPTGRGRGRKVMKKRFGGQMDDAKRAQHNNMERQRRVELRDLFELVRSLTPSTTDEPKAAKVKILTDAANYVEKLRAINENQVKEKEYLYKEQCRLRKIVSNWRTLFANNQWSTAVPSTYEEES